MLCRPRQLIPLQQRGVLLLPLKWVALHELLINDVGVHDLLCLDPEEFLAESGFELGLGLYVELWDV